MDTPLLRIQSSRDRGGPNVLYVYLRHKVPSSSDPWSSLNQQLKILKESWIIMPEFTRDNCAPLGQEFFDSMDRVDEGALARLIVEMQLNKLQDLPDLRTLFFRRKQQQMNYVASQYGRIPAYRAVQQQYTPVRGKPWAMHA
ncbi:unnamed protein product [Porites evermanni]|uniref:Uncharacterized protein n=1 Tax=Porites evermanni TaxID=104178 RepID=A0ABN8LTF0_9CNID|nr:unnamed protein product [Porites evermanni]